MTTDYKVADIALAEWGRCPAATRLPVQANAAALFSAAWGLPAAPSSQRPSALAASLLPAVATAT